MRTITRALKLVDEVPTNGREDKQNPMYSYKVPVLSLKKEGISDLCSKVDKPGKHHTSEVSQTQKRQILNFCEVPRGVTVPEVGSRWWVLGAGGKVLTRRRISLLQDGKVLEALAVMAVRQHESA